jgi:hypothetical protein
MKKIIFSLIFILLSSSSYAFDKWNIQDTILQTTFGILLFVDMKQTIWISEHPVINESYYDYNRNIFVSKKRYYSESNPILGSHPSKKNIIKYFSVCMLIDTSIAYILPVPYRNIFQLGSIFIEINPIIHNYNAGVKFNI